MPEVKYCDNIIFCQAEYTCCSSFDCPMFSIIIIDILIFSNIEAVPVGISRGVKKLLKNKVPNLGSLKEIDDFVTGYVFIYLLFFSCSYFLVIRQNNLSEVITEALDVGPRTRPALYLISTTSDFVLEDITFYFANLDLLCLVFGHDFYHLISTLKSLLPSFRSYNQHLLSL